MQDCYELISDRLQDREVSRVAVCSCSQPARHGTPLLGTTIVWNGTRYTSAWGPGRLAEHWVYFS